MTNSIDTSLSSSDNTVKPSDTLNSSGTLPITSEASTRSGADVAVTPPEQGGFEQILSLFDAGGLVIMILAVMSLIATMVFLAKCFQFYSVGLNRQKVVYGALKLWLAKQPDVALTQLNVSRSPAAQVLKAAMSLKSQSSVRDEVIREEVLRRAKRELASARSYLKVLEIIATLSPLLGLLGTVLGMITAFQKLQGAGSTIDPSVLSGGIWEALLTTAAGLVVAISAVMALNWLEQRVDRFKLMMEDCVTQIFTAEAFQASYANESLKGASAPKMASQRAASKSVDEPELALSN